MTGRDPSDPTTWTNWSGGVHCEPIRHAAPADEEEVASVVAGAAAEGLSVRVHGSGHSFTPLCATDGVLVDLARLAGVVATDPDRHTATVLAGTPLSELGEPLRVAGLALHNQGDVDVQTLAGAIGTGTHGTGVELGNLSTAVVGARVVLAGGDVVDCDTAHEPDLFAAARLSLGAIGVVTRFDLALVPAYDLHERIWYELAATCLARLDERVGATRHFEFFWYPAKDLCELKALHPSDRGPDPLPHRARERIDHSHRVFPTVRDLRFEEMEYAIPAEAGPPCFAALRDLYRAHHPDVGWPIEYRTVGADDVWLSPARGRATVTLSVHQDATLPHQPLFADCETVMRAHGGRPHWGKRHSCGAADLAPLYPEWDRFWAVRAALDPDGRFLNHHLRTLGGLDR